MICPSKWVGTPKIRHEVFLFCLLQKYDTEERAIHDKCLHGVYRDRALLQSSSVFSRDWWSSQKFFWERTLPEIPHCVVFVFDGSRDPFLESESSEFFRNVFEDCSRMGKYP